MRYFLALYLMTMAEAAQAFSCLFPGIPILDSRDIPQTEEERRRLVAKSYAAFYEHRTSADVLVVGRFSRRHDIPFLHEEQFEALSNRSVHEPNMPYRIEYTYLDAFEFAGNKIEDGKLVPFVQEDIDVIVRFSAEYDGMLDKLPADKSDLIGVLYHQGRSDPPQYELEVSICPLYSTIGAIELDELLICYREGECK